ncbi:hypothetical protein BBK36DRAFT_160461 [Trichoderma citrinoviride]|uniref:Transcription factor domain-containing protein n=1 Tax=Trichoderma citrinoviride TaxID=58853 RepID=A0A2T4BC45_9HYPO|nr:hypothetical protein BBK36DRAFT_160461 [Trichoderma citrinoviride]PTB66897.1 hypothetical protein BBK36DRAFT_160461 [Trichoderma citrinoviride]
METNSPSDATINPTNIHGPTSPEIGFVFSHAGLSANYQDEHVPFSSPPNLSPSLPQSNIFDPEFWQDNVPLLIRSNVAVQSANLAVLILIFAQSAAGMGTNHYGKALWHYGRALRLVREDTSTSSSRAESLRPAILCCLFFVIFEIMNGDTTSAESHLWNGENMLLELQRLEARQRGGIELGVSVDMDGDGDGDGNGQGALRRELPCALQFLVLQSDEPSLDFERAGYLEAFLRMATSNLTEGGYSDELTEGVERLL